MSEELASMETVDPIPTEKFPEIFKLELAIKKALPLAESTTTFPWTTLKVLTIETVGASISRLPPITTGVIEEIVVELESVEFEAVDTHWPPTHVRLRSEPPERGGHLDTGVGLDATDANNDEGTI